MGRFGESSTIKVLMLSMYCMNPHKGVLGPIPKLSTTHVTLYESDTSESIT